MAKTKKQYSPEFKLKAVIEILKGEKTATQIGRLKMEIEWLKKNWEL